MASFSPSVDQAGNLCGSMLPEVDNVDSLCSLCVKYLAANLQVFCAYDYDRDFWSLQPGVYLPPQVSEDLLATMEKSHVEMSEGVLHIFADTAAAPLRRVSIDTSDMSDIGLGWILSHNLTELDLVWGNSLTEKSFLAIQEHSTNLTRLAIRNAGSLLKFDLISGLPENPSFSMFLTAGDLGSVDPIAKDLVATKLHQTTEEGAVAVRLKSPRLRSLTLQSLGLIRHGTPDFLEHLCRPLVTLTHLDLSHCPVLVDSLTWLSELTQLMVLILHCVPIRDLGVAFDNIAKLQSLRSLDVSTSHRDSHMFIGGEVYLARLIQSLPRLARLDLSGTNIAVQHEVPDHPDAMDTNSVCGIKGLEGCHLQFLGLLGCPGFELPPHNIPARMVAASWGIEPLLVAGRVYADRKSMTSMLLPGLLGFLRTMEFTDTQYKQALKIVLDAMQSYINSFSIAHYSVLSLAILLHNKGQWVSTPVKRSIIVAMLDLMECQRQKTHFSKPELMRKCCATLSYFDLANDMLFVYERVVALMMSLITTNAESLSHLPLIQTALFILRYMSSQVDVCYKETAGRLGCIKKMLRVINCSVSPDRDGDTVLLRAWSVLWSLTDMSPSNCERFLAEDGLATFMECYHCLPNDTSLINKMVGMLRNVVEVPHLRKELMSEEYISIFSYMLDAEPNISNSSCSILAHLLADSPHLIWTDEVPYDDTMLAEDPMALWPGEESSRQLILRMETAIRSWDLSTRRNVRYRSFEPMLQLLRCYDPMVSMHWAVWEVANMVIKDAVRYCPMLEKEGGIDLVMELLQDPRPPPHIKRLGDTVIHRYRAWQEAPRPGGT